MQNTIALLINYIPATNTKGSRVSLHSPRFKKRKYIPFNSMYNSTSAVALAYLEFNGIFPVAEAEGKNGEHVLLVSFDQVEKVLKL